MYQLCPQNYFCPFLCLLKPVPCFLTLNVCVQLFETPSVFASMSFCILVQSIFVFGIIFDKFWTQFCPTNPGSLITFFFAVHIWYLFPPTNIFDTFWFLNFLISFCRRSANDGPKPFLCRACVLLFFLYSTQPPDHQSFLLPASPHSLNGWSMSLKLKSGENDHFINHRQDYPPPPPQPTLRPSTKPPQTRQHPQPFRSPPSTPISVTKGFHYLTCTLTWNFNYPRFHLKVLVDNFAKICKNQKIVVDNSANPRKKSSKILSPDNFLPSAKLSHSESCRIRQ